MRKQPHAIIFYIAMIAHGLVQITSYRSSAIFSALMVVCGSLKVIPFATLLYYTFSKDIEKSVKNTLPLLYIALAGLILCFACRVFYNYDIGYTPFIGWVDTFCWHTFAALLIIERIQDTKSLIRLATRIRKERVK